MPSLVPSTFDDSRWISSNAWLSQDPEVRIHYIDCPPSSSKDHKGTIVLIHGFPQTSYQFRHVITPFSDAGYRVIAPDYRGAGESSKPRDGEAGGQGKVHVIGHDIGGMVAHAYASRFADDTASVSWGECPLPGTKAYYDSLMDPGVWHFHFHWQLDLPEAMTHGNERIYIKSFYDRLCLNPAAIGVRDLEHYATMFAQPGAMRAGFDVYRGFHKDAEENKEWLQKHGKCKVPSLSLSGASSFLQAMAEGMVNEVYENVEVATVESSGHWAAEENPADFVRKNLAFIEKYLV
ncbi:hypothetical protein H2203_007814 [Taxawa tesnikishii (nom. ined.)]|nr:hypothetical protein H2203_007814 [Dothideales sp. JES 119]